MDQDSAAETIARLTPQQIRLLKLVASGLSASKALSRETGLQPASIDTYLQSAARILEAANRGSAASRLFELEQISSQSASQLRVEPVASVADQRPSGVVKAVRRFFLGLPLGGQQHDLSWTGVLVQVLRVAAIGIIGGTALTLLLLGMLRTFR